MSRLFRPWPVGALCWALLAGCDQSSPAEDPLPAGSLLTEGIEARLVEVRPCRSSVEHPFNHVRVLVEPELKTLYDSGPFPFPAGALVVKREYSDRDCQVAVGTTLMRKEEAGYFPSFGDWRWQRLDAAGQVREDGQLATCASCHSTPTCRGRDFVCSDPD